MLKFFARLLLLAVGIAASDICEIIEPCSPQGLPREFPGTREELLKVCKPVIAYIECEIHQAETCMNFVEERLQEGYRILAAIREVCSEDTLLHAAVVDNLACFKKLIDSDVVTCRIYTEEDDKIISQIIEALNNEGMLSLDNENVTDHLHRCIETLNFIACRSLLVEKSCGTVAMEAYAEISQKLRMSGGEPCEDTFELLPSVIRLRRVIENKELDIAKAFRRRK